MTKLKLLFVHPPVGNAFELFLALKNNSCLEVELLSGQKFKPYRLSDKLKHHLKIPPDKLNYNAQLGKRNFSDIDILFIVKGIMIYPFTLRIIKKKYAHVKIVSWSQDDMYAWHNRSIYYTLGLKLYDLICTTKSYNLKELPKLGAKQIFFHNKVYSSRLHRPMKRVDSPYSHDVLFIGALEKERFDSLNFLASHGIVIHVYSDFFKKKEYRKYHPNLIINDGLYGDNYAEAISNSKITLCYLRKINRDLQTSRSIEIPACGGCMVAEKTTEHIALFEENKEAVFFETDEELLHKVRDLLKNEMKRKQIAQNGYLRCQTSGYSYDDLAKKLNHQFNLLLIQ